MEAVSIVGPVGDDLASSPSTRVSGKETPRLAEGASVQYRGHDELL
nr:hypothetical protein [Sinorhizobium meliloti]